MEKASADCRQEELATITGDRKGALTMLDTSSCERCSWAQNDPLMQAYHDAEWGVPQRDPRMLWEMLMLEGFQAGLAWIIILRKRKAFRAALMMSQGVV